MVHAQKSPMFVKPKYFQFLNEKENVFSTQRWLEIICWMSTFTSVTERDKDWARWMLQIESQKEISPRVWLMRRPYMYTK